MIQQSHPRAYIQKKTLIQKDKCNQWKFAVWLRQLKLELCNNLKGWEKVGGGREVHEWGGTWDSPGKSTGVGCHCLLQANIINKVKIQLSNWVLIFAIHIINIFIRERLTIKKKETKTLRKRYKRHIHCWQ